jgi:hypothetical protein
VKNKFTVFLALFILVFGASSASATYIELGFLIDSSGSIGSGNFSTMRSNIANAFNSVLPIDSSVKVSVVRFATGSTVITNSLLIDSQTALDTLVANISSMSYSGGSTAMSTGISTLEGLMDYTGDKQIFNILTDGVPNSTTNTISARNSAISAGVDEIDAEFIGSTGSSGYNFLINDIVSPQPGHIAPPYTPGFVAAVNFNNLQDAFESKLVAYTTPSNSTVPEPGTVLLFGFGLIGLAGVRRRSKKN